MWVLNSRSAARVHDFDVRLIPSPVLQPVLDEAAEMLTDTAQMAAGCTWTPDQATQAELPGPLAGLGLRLMRKRLLADAAFWAAWTAHSKSVPKLAAALGRPLREVAGEKDAAEAAKYLLSKGIVVDEARPTFTEEAASKWENCHWSADC